MLGKRLKREGEEEKKVINRFPKPPPNECVFVDTEQLATLAGTSVVLKLAFSINNFNDRFIPVPKTFYAVITHRQAIPTQGLTQLEHDEEAEIHKNSILRCDTFLQFLDSQGKTEIISYFNNMQLPLLLAFLRLTGVQPYRQHVLLTLLMGAFHARVGQGSSLYRQFSRTYLGESRILRLIMEF
jgi:hypothetical protein